jgi:putative CRISPR-associated protein (TIGR02620 family)
MTTWFVTRHPGAIAWAQRQGIVAAPSVDSDERITDSITPAEVSLGDTVFGTLPVHLAAEICTRGGRYFHITMTVPGDRRGEELTPDDMDAFGATCREFIVIGSPGTAVQAAAVPAPGQGIHVCLVSDQHMANLLPILKRRPAHVELVCTPEMLQPGRGLERIARSLQRYGYGAGEVTPHSAPRESSTDFHVARQFARQLRNQLLQAYPGQTLTLNATGGTKALSSAFFLEFQGLETLYTDTQGGGYIRHMENATQPAEKLGSLIAHIDDYLHCQGYRLTHSASDDESWRQTARQRRDVSTTLVEALSSRGQSAIGGLIGQLNRQAQQVEESVLKEHIPGNAKSAPRERRTKLLEQHVPATALSGFFCPEPAQPLAERLIDARLLVRNAASRYFFSSLDAMRYLGGGWLEEWAWLIANDCGVDDCRAGVFIQASEEGKESSNDDNEMDLVILHQNRLLIAECKTINWQGANGKQDILNKLDALGSHARGLFGHSLLVSARPLDEDASRRAELMASRCWQATTCPG